MGLFTLTGSRAVLELQEKLEHMITGKDVLDWKDVKKSGEKGADKPGIWSGLDLESFLLDLDNLLELQNTLAAPSAERERLRKYSAADYQRLAVIGRRVFVLALSHVGPSPHHPITEALMHTSSFLHNQKQGDSVLCGCVTQHQNAMHLCVALMI